MVHKVPVGPSKLYHTRDASRIASLVAQRELPNPDAVAIAYMSSLHYSGVRPLNTRSNPSLLHSARAIRFPPFCQLDPVSRQRLRTPQAEVIAQLTVPPQEHVIDYPHAAVCRACRSCQNTGMAFRFPTGPAPGFTLSPVSRRAFDRRGAGHVWSFIKIDNLLSVLTL